MKRVLLLTCIFIIAILSACSANVLKADSSPEVSANITSQAPTSRSPAPGVSPEATTTVAEIISDVTFVNAKDYLSGICVELKYATEDNFTSTVLYDFTDAYLRYGTVKKLMLVQDELAAQGYSLKIWDAFRPISMQFKLWEICPDPAYVADPNKGYSSHSKGNTVDVTLVNADGSEVQMPSAFDDFSALADRDYSDVSADAAVNAKILEDAMKNNGFSAYEKEWWHFSDSDSYAVEKTFCPS